MSAPGPDRGAADRAVGPPGSHLARAPDQRDSGFPDRRDRPPTSLKPMVSGDVPPATTVHRHRRPAPPRRSRRARAVGIPIGQLAIPATILALGALARRVARWSLRRRFVGARGPGPAEAETEASARLAATRQTLDETTARLHAVTEELGETRADLTEAQAEVLRVNGRAQALTDQAEAEMGRMESAAITALESAAASNRQDVADLRQRLATAQDAARILRAERDTERRQSEQLQSALASRDTQLANLRASARHTDDHRS